MATEVAGTMRDALGRRVTVGVRDGVPAVLGGAPAILGTPELDGEFTGLWGAACGLAGISPQDGSPLAAGKAAGDGS